MERKVRVEREPRKKRSVAFKATPSISEGNEIMDDDEDEFSMIMRKVEKMFFKQGKMNNHRRSKWQGKGERKKEEIGPCYNCKKSGYLIVDYPNLKVTISKRIPKKKL